MPISKSAQRITQLAAAITLLCAIFVFALWWLGSWNNINDQISRSAQIISRTAWLVAHEGEIRSQFQGDQNTTSSLTAAYITEASSDKASAALQRYLKDAIETSGGSIVSAQPIPFQADGVSKAVATRFQFSLPQKALPALLQSVEMKSPYIFIDQAEIASTSPNTADGSQSDAPLMIQLEAHSFWRGATGAK